MWARVAELMIGLWLVLSPLIFRGTEAIERFVTVDVAAGSAVVLFSLLSFWERTAWAHLATAALAASLGLFAYFGWDRPGPPAAQNEIAVAMLLVLLGIIPNEASQPPKAWRGAPATSDSSAANSSTPNSSTPNSSTPNSSTPNSTPNSSTPNARVSMGLSSSSGPS